MVTFNVIFTPGSVARLLPFGLSLLNGEGVRVRLVANGCEEPEDEMLVRAARDGERLSNHRLASEHVIEHGLALNELFETFDDGPFAFADSDVLASGDFMHALWPADPEEAAVFAAPPVWLSPQEEASSAHARFLSGRNHRLADGTPVGGTYCAIYRREAAEAAWREAPRGFGCHHWHELPRSLRARLNDQGWRFRTYDTGRLVNLQLLLAGHRLANRDAPALHHVGGMSARAFEGAVGLRSSIGSLVRSGSGGRVSRAWRGVVLRIVSAADRDRSRQGRRRRRRVVLEYLDAVLDAVTAGGMPPPAPATGSTEVDRRVAALVDALVREYPRQMSLLGESARSG